MPSKMQVLLTHRRRHTN